MRMKKRVYDEQFRKDALGLVKRGRSARTVSEDLGVPLSTVLYWCTMAKKKGRVRAPATAPSSASDVESPEEEIARLKEENAKLRKKNAELEMDRAILKKAAVHSTGRCNTMSPGFWLKDAVMHARSEARVDGQ